MKKILFRFISFTVAVCVIAFCFTGCDSNSNKQTIRLPRYNEDGFSSNYSESGVAVENEYLEILWDNSKRTVSFREKETGIVWGQIPQTTVDSGMQMTNALKSAVYVYYRDSSNLGEKYAFSSEGAVDGGNVWANQFENGLSVTYDFIDYSFSVTVDYILDGKNFSVVVDPRKMSDDGENYITAVSVMPFICGVENDNETDWLFMPDGEGSVIKPKTMSQMGVEGNKKIYGEDLSVRQFNYQAISQQVNMPVFGVSKENGGLFAIVSSGAEQTELCWNMGSSSVGYSSLYPKYRLRGYSTIKTPENFLWTSLNYIKLFDESVTEKVFRVDYTTLKAEENSLIGMAKVYKEYLEKEHNLSKSNVKQVVADYKFIGAIQNPAFVLGIPTTELLALTTTKDVEKIISDISGKIGNNFSVNLIGFGKSGVDVGEIGGGYTVASKLGGKKGLKKLGTYLTQNNIKGYMDFDIISYSKSGSGFSYNNDSATLTNGPSAIYNDYNSVGHGEIEKNYHILSRKLLPDAVMKVIERKDMLAGLGVSFNTLSSSIYSDYSYNDFRNCKNMASDVKSLLSAVRKQKISVKSASANDYAACISDVLTDCPISTSKYDFETYSVPFYQMVFRGYKPMSSVSINLTHEEDDSILSCVESGTAPSYTIIAKYDNDLRNSNYSFIYGSVYNENTEYYTSSVKATEEYFNSIDGQGITDYIVLNKDVRITKYSNGVYVVVNYGDSDYQSEYGLVNANDYITGSVN